MTEDTPTTDTPMPDDAASPSVEATEAPPAPEAEQSKAPAKAPAASSADTPAEPVELKKPAKPVKVDTPQAAVEAPPVEQPAPTVAAATPTAGGWFWGTGRRKASVARVRVRAGDGKFQVNGHDLKKFFSQERDHNDIGAVLEATNTTGALEVQVKVHGGGYTGQAGAIRLGLGRALMRYDGTLEQTLRNRGYLSRDPRRVERKKPGQPGARKRFQFSKR